MFKKVHKSARTLQLFYSFRLNLIQVQIFHTILLLFKSCKILLYFHLLFLKSISFLYYYTKFSKKQFPWNLKYLPCTHYVWALKVEKSYWKQNFILRHSRTVCSVWQEALYCRCILEITMVLRIRKNAMVMAMVYYRHQIVCT